MRGSPRPAFSPRDCPADCARLIPAATFRSSARFWENRYHTTVIESGEHLRRCLLYINLNMVRAGVVKHPGEWVRGGYHEIQSLRRRNTILALDVLAEAVETRGLEEEPRRRERGIYRKTRQMLGMRGRSRDAVPVGDACMLREPQEPMEAILLLKIGP